MAEDENRKIKFTISREELFTEELQYHAQFYPLTGVHWQILKGVNANQLVLGAAAGFLVPELINLGIKAFRREPLSFGNVFAGFVVVLGVYVWGRFSDTKRRRLVKAIDDRLLSDKEIGL